MRIWSWLSIALFVAAGALLLIGALSGEVEVGLFVIFPFILGHGAFAALAILLVIIGIIMLTVGATTGLSMRTEEGGHPVEHPRETTEGGRRFGGVVLIGPVPIAFGSDRRLALAMLVIGLVLLAALLLLYFLLWS